MEIINAFYKIDYVLIYDAFIIAIFEGNHKCLKFSVLIACTVNIARDNFYYWKSSLGFSIIFGSVSFLRPTSLNADGLDKKSIKAKNHHSLYPKFENWLLSRIQEKKGKHLVSSKEKIQSHIHTLIHSTHFLASTMTTHRKHKNWQIYRHIYYSMFTVWPKNILKPPQEWSSWLNYSTISYRRWWTGRPGVLRFMGLQRVRHDWATELNRVRSIKDSINNLCF